MPLRFFFVIFFLSHYTWAQDLTAYLDSAGKSAKISLLIHDTEGRELYGQGSQSKIPSASIIKIPILFTLLHHVEEGNVSLDEKFALTEEETVGGTGDLQLQPMGSKFSLDSLAREMIRTSDNTATNIIIKRLGLSSVNNKMAELGLKNTQLNRLMMDFGAIAAGRQNYTSPAEINQLLLMLYGSEGLSEFSQKLMIDMLLACADDKTIPSQLPPGVAVAHKSGTLDYIRGDAGIILSSTPIIISIFVEEFSSTEDAENIIGTVARLAYEIYGK